jgi:hypothetical protein
MWIGCYDWSARKILWVAWTWNALVQTIWGLLAVVQGQKISKLYDTFEENDRTSANLVTGIVATCAWAVVLIGLFLIFSLVVLLRKVRVACGFREKKPERPRQGPPVARQPTRATPTSKTNANVERAHRKTHFHAESVHTVAPLPKLNTPRPFLVRHYYSRPPKRNDNAYRPSPRRARVSLTV